MEPHIHQEQHGHHNQHLEGEYTLVQMMLEQAPQMHNWLDLLCSIHS
jgi:hypothetical protein